VALDHIENLFGIEALAHYDTRPSHHQDRLQYTVQSAIVEKGNTNERDIVMPEITLVDHSFKDLYICRV
jgi:hypothetical protein